MIIMQYVSKFVYHLLAISIFCNTMLTSALAQAQATAITSEGAEFEESITSTVTYEGEFFSQYNPNTINDMLPWIPGISLALGGNGGGPGGSSRGLGGAENILINGQRIAGKSNDARNQLSRIPAAEVDYIEIIRGTSGNLGVRSTGQIINIVLHSSLSRTNMTAEVNADLDDDGTLKPGGSFSYSRQQGKLAYLFSASAEPRYELRESFETSVNGDLSPNDSISRKEERDQTNIEFNVSASYDLTPTDRFQFNALWEEMDPPQDIARIITDLESDPIVESFEREDIDANRDGWEYGGDFEHLFPGNSRFRALAIVSRQDVDSFRERFVRDNRDDEELKDLVLNSGSVSKERILRSSFAWNISSQHNLELGLELAQNILESKLAQGVTGGTGMPTPQSGGLPALTINNANTEVEEKRYEPFVVHNWQINPRINLETELVAEFSKIEQSGDTSNKRSFRFLRPSFDFRYDLTPSIQLRARVQKLVSQLNLRDFVATSDPRDDERDTEVGNPGLSQEKTWRYEFNFEYRLPDDLGVINTKIFYEDIENVIDRIDLTPSSEEPSGVTGNIGDAEKYGLEITSSTRLNFLNLPGAIFTAGLRLEDSSVSDPILGIDRRLQQSGRGSANIGFLHDIPALALNYGFDARFSFNGGSKRFDINRIESFRSEPFMRVFVQKTAFNGVVFRLEAQNALDNGRCRIRRRFDSRISDPLPSEIERSCSDTGRQITLKVRATF